MQPILLMSARIESLTAPEALGVSLLGFMIVFLVLVVLMAVIRLLRVIVVGLAKPAPAVADSAAAPVAAPVAAPADAGLRLYDVDNATAAMIMAIVAYKMDAPLNELRFTSIRKKLSERT